MCVCARAIFCNHTFSKINFVSTVVSLDLLQVALFFLGTIETFRWFQNTRAENLRVLRVMRCKWLVCETNKTSRHFDSRAWTTRASSVIRTSDKEHPRTWPSTGQISCVAGAKRRGSGDVTKRENSPPFLPFQRMPQRRRAKKLSGMKWGWFPSLSFRSFFYWMEGTSITQQFAEFLKNSSLKTFVSFPE